MNYAKLISETTDRGINQSHFELLEPIENPWKENAPTNNVVVSTAVVFGELETLVFPCNSDGKIGEFLDIRTFRSWNHDFCLRCMDIDVIESGEFDQLKRHKNK